MSLAPAEFDLELIPRARVDVIDVRRLVSQRFGDGLDAYPKALCCSFHTTAGYLDQGLATRLIHSRGGVMSYINVFRTMFPEGAGYEHDKIDRRTELTEAQKPEEPRNADSHLAFMAGALRTCVTYRNRPNEPVCFIDLDGVHDGRPRKRRTSVLGYSNEEPVAQARIVVPVSRHAVDSVNLKNPRLGIYEQCQQLVARARRHEGPHPPVAGARRAQRGPDGQRVRNAADAPRPVGSAARSAALHGREGGAHARQPARDSGQDARLREVRPRARLQPAARCRRPARVDGRERAGAGDRDAGVALPAHEALGQPVRVRPHRAIAARSSKAPTRVPSSSSGTAATARRACSTSR